jgi:hypothetical protein
MQQDKGNGTVDEFGKGNFLYYNELRERNLSQRGYFTVLFL